MADQKDFEPIVDTYGQHVAYHQSYHSDCSECFKENRMIKAWKTVNVNVPRKVCGNHDISNPLIGAPCRNCNRLSLSAYEY